MVSEGESSGITVRDIKRALVTATYDYDGPSLSPKEMEKVYRRLDELAANGTVEPST